MSSILTRFGTVISELRSRRGLTQAELAARAGVHRTYLSGIECGSRNPTLETIEHLAVALDVSLFSIFRKLGQ